MTCIYDEYSQETHDDRLSNQRIYEMYDGEYYDFLKDYYELLDYEEYFDYGGDGFNAWYTSKHS